MKCCCAFLSSKSKVKMEKCIDVTCANDIYPIIGDGICQIIIVGVICLLMIPSGIPQFVMIFLSQTPEWVLVDVRNNSSSQNDLCKLNKSEWKWARPVDYSIVSEVKHSLCESVQIRSFFWSGIWRFFLVYYAVNLRIQSKYRKIRTRKRSVFGHFLRSD